MNLDDLPRPVGAFASDNQAGAHPAVIEALVAANSGHEPSYGYDRFTAATDEQFRSLFDHDVDVYYVWSGTGANVMALTSLVGPAGGVVCTDWSHINIDETGAPERIAGCKLIDLPCSDGRMTADQLRSTFSLLGDEHHVQPQVLSITQSTELGTLYSLDELGAVVDHAHSLGMTVHLDGARIANAAAALGVPLRAVTTDLGVDVLSFGGTKNGAMLGEAVVVLNPESAPGVDYLRKTSMQLASKMRFVSAQLLALLTDDLWLRNASHANAMAADLAARVIDLPGLTVTRAVQANAVFATLPADVTQRLQERFRFYTWDQATGEVRWMCSWDTTAADVDAFAAAVAEELARS